LSLAWEEDQAQKSRTAIGVYLAITLIYEVACKCREAFPESCFYQITCYSSFCQTQIILLRLKSYFARLMPFSGNRIRKRYRFDALGLTRRKLACYPTRLTAKNIIAAGKGQESIGQGLSVFSMFYPALRVCVSSPLVSLQEWLLGWKQHPGLP
jgi:hypothetical protein